MPEPFNTSRSTMSLKGHLLIAKPNMGEGHFQRAVVLVLKHSHKGTLGLVLNKSTHISMAKAWEQVSEVPCHSEDMVYVGGPCEGPIMAIHDRADRSQIEVMPGVYTAIDMIDIQWLIEHGVSPVRYFVGHSGWAANQLEAELLAGAWDVLPATTDILFHADPQDLWDSLHQTLRQKVRYADLPAILIPGDPSDN